MKWILFVYLLSSTADGGMTMTSAEFNTKMACDDAATKLSDEFKSYRIESLRVVCVEKGLP